MELHPHEPYPDAASVYRDHFLPLYSFLVVSRTKPELVVRAISPKWLQKHLKEHPRDLQCIRRGDLDFVVSSSTAEFQAFLVRHLKADGALSEALTLVRAEPTTKPATK